MAGFEGMDIAHVQSIGNQLKHQADQINSVVAAINSLVAQLPGVWHGKDATEFENWWNTQHRPHLQQAAAAVQGLGQSALNNATDQANTSNR